METGNEGTSNVGLVFCIGPSFQQATAVILTQPTTVVSTMKPTINNPNKVSNASPIQTLCTVPTTSTPAEGDVLFCVHCGNNVEFHGSL